MTFEGVVQALFENERRLAEMTVQEHQLAIHSVPSQRSRRFEKDSDGKQVSWTDKRQTARDTRSSNSSARDTRPARDSRPTNNARPSRAQNQPQQKGGGCANHPMVLHGPEGYRYLAKGNCDFLGAGGCRFKHSAAVRPPGHQYASKRQRINSLQLRNSESNTNAHQEFFRSQRMQRSNRKRYHQQGNQ